MPRVGRGVTSLRLIHWCECCRLFGVSRLSTSFIEAFERMANQATKAGVESQAFQIHAPLLHLTKGEIIQKGVKLGVNYEDTVSCYRLTDTGEACGRCDACVLRKEAS